MVARLAEDNASLRLFRDGKELPEQLRLGESRVGFRGRGPRGSPSLE